MMHNGFWIFKNPLLNNKEYWVHTSVLSEEDANEIFDQIKFFSNKLNPLPEIGRKLFDIEIEGDISLDNFISQITTEVQKIYKIEDINEQIFIKSVKFQGERGGVKSYKYIFSCDVPEKTHEVADRTANATDNLLYIFFRLEKLQLKYMSDITPSNG
jgi:hypothetical protein